MTVTISYRHEVEARGTEGAAATTKSAKELETVMERRLPPTPSAQGGSHRPSTGRAGTGATLKSAEDGVLTKLLRFLSRCEECLC